MSKTAVSRAERPVKCLGEGDVAGVVSGDVCAQLKGSVHEPKCGKPGDGDVTEVIYGLLESLVGDGASEPAAPQNGRCLDVDKVRCGKFLVLAQQLTRLATGFLVVADGVGQHGSVDDDHLRERSAARSVAA